MLKLLVPFLIVSSVVASASARDLADSTTIVRREDGMYTVTCADGTAEVVSEADVRAGNLCPRLTEDVPVTTLTEGAYRVAGNTYFLNQRLTVRNWAAGQYIVSGGIRYGQYQADFRVPVAPEAIGSNVFSGEASLISGTCSWTIRLRLFAYAGKFYLQDYAPQTIYDDCNNGNYGWTPTELPFVLQTPQ